MQHYVQGLRSPRLVRANHVLYENLKRFEPNATATDIPTEREANIVSKRVAEAVCGEEAVKCFAEAQVKFMRDSGNTEQYDRWVFFRDVSPSTTYDALKPTLSLVERYKAVIDFKKAGLRVDEPEWWVGPLEG